MDSRSILQRCCAIATGVPFSRLRTKNLNNVEWEKVAMWWANRFINGQEKLKSYREERNFDKFHTALKTDCELDPNRHIDVIYDPSLTLSKIKAELDKKVKIGNVGMVIVDYINQVKRSAIPSKSGQYDWTEQIEVSKTLKSMAQEYETTVFSPYQTDASGEARFAKGILDAADAAYTINAWSQEDSCMTLNCVKMRSAAEKSFTSTMDWETLKIGPNTAMNPKEIEASAHKTGEEINDI
jgi:replicative DNA helicase